ncbi:MAG TPA: GNAT family N-acetyltransferase [Ktedonobacteraceae bacterium]|nr:GNAT family N-acetyltransferase [Ktedonobacteraceae bacterium]
MIEERQLVPTECEGIASPHVKTVQTQAGTLFLRNRCPACLVESLEIDDGMRAFARRPEREHQLLVNIARREDSALTLAYTPSRKIVGQVTVAPADAWWSGLEHVYETAIEVSANWRRQGIARGLLTFAAGQEELENMILLAMGLSWHWDTEGLGLRSSQYRELIARLFASLGFVEYLTSEPNIRMDPANIFLARIGRNVDQQTINAFLNRLLASPSLPGM